MPYELLALLLSVGLVIRYLLGDEASRGAKAAMAALVGVSLAVWWQYPQWSVAATVLQVAAGIVMLTHIRVRS